MDAKDNKVSCESDEQQKKKNYKKPEFRTYGDIRAITRGGANSPNSDSGKNLMSPP